MTDRMGCAFAATATRASTVLCIAHYRKTACRAPTSTKDHATSHPLNGLSAFVQQDTGGPLVNIRALVAAVSRAALEVNARRRAESVRAMALRMVSLANSLALEDFPTLALGMGTAQAVDIVIATATAHTDTTAPPIAPSARRRMSVPRVVIDATHLEALSLAPSASATAILLAMTAVSHARWVVVGVPVPDMGYALLTATKTLRSVSAKQITTALHAKFCALCHCVTRSACFDHNATQGLGHVNANSLSEGTSQAPHATTAQRSTGVLSAIVAVRATITVTARGTQASASAFRVTRSEEGASGKADRATSAQVVTSASRVLLEMRS